MAARAFLTLVGALYVLLAIWCSVQPQRTSGVVGFELRPGGGQSEFLTVYGGLELGLGIMFLWPLISAPDTAYALRACLLIHGCLVLFRSISFALYSGIPANTYNLAAAEWLIFLVAAAIWWFRNPTAAGPSPL